MFGKKKEFKFCHNEQDRDDTIKEYLDKYGWCKVNEWNYVWTNPPVTVWVVSVNAKEKVKWR